MISEQLRVDGNVPPGKYCKKAIYIKYGNFQECNNKFNGGHEFGPTIRRFCTIR